MAHGELNHVLTQPLVPETPADYFPPLDYFLISQIGGNKNKAAKKTGPPAG